jgi:hypothetical protein
MSTARVKQVALLLICATALACARRPETALPPPAAVPTHQPDSPPASPEDQFADSLPYDSILARARRLIDSASTDSLAMLVGLLRRRLDTLASPVASNAQIAERVSASVDPVTVAKCSLLVCSPDSTATAFAVLDKVYVSSTGSLRSRRHEIERVAGALADIVRVASDERGKVGPATASALGSDWTAAGILQEAWAPPTGAVYRAALAYRTALFYSRALADDADRRAPRPGPHYARALRLRDSILARHGVPTGRPRHTRVARSRSRRPRDAAIPSPNPVPVVAQGPDSLLPGSVAHNIPAKMRQGVKYVIDAYVARGAITSSESLFTGLGGAPVVVKIRIPKFTQLVLEGDNDDTSAFRIRPSRVNAVKEVHIESVRRKLGDDYATWSWDVTPLQSGSHRLRLLVMAVRITETRKDTLNWKEVATIIVPVEVNYWYVAAETGRTVATHVGGNLPWYGGSGGLVALLTLLIRRERPSVRRLRRPPRPAPPIFYWQASRPPTYGGLADKTGPRGADDKKSRAQEEAARPRPSSQHGSELGSVDRMP